MLSRFFRVFVAFLMMISPKLPNLIDLPGIPQGQEVNLEERFVLTWSDEFEGDLLDANKWQTEWWVTQRKGGYWHDDMVSVKDGNLIIKTQYFEQPLENPYLDKWGDIIDFDEFKEGWYSACINTDGKFEQTYGYFECRCILPKASGMWSAFWLMNEGVFNVDGSGQDGTEIDVFESMYYKDVKWGFGDAVSSNIHYDGYEDAHVSDTAGKWFANDPYEQFNTYGLEWNKNEYIFYINGVETNRLSTGGVSQNPEYLLLSCEVSGSDGIPTTKTGGVGKMSMNPGEVAEFIVDYVRVYQYK